MNYAHELVRPANDNDRKRAFDGHFLRSRIKEEKVVRVVPVLFGLWADETSGTLSKRSAHFETWQFHLANIAVELNQHPGFIRFIAAAKGVECLDIANAVVLDIQKKLENRNLAIDPDSNQVLLVGTAVYLMGDGPKLSIFCSYSGVQSAFFCRMADLQQISWQRVTCYTCSVTFFVVTRNHRS